MTARAPIRLSAADKLHLLRRLDTFRQWSSLDERRFCKRCNRTISGRQIEVIGGTRGRGSLRLQCPTPRCDGSPRDWIDADPTAAAAAYRDRANQPEAADAEDALRKKVTRIYRRHVSRVLRPRLARFEQRRTRARVVRWLGHVSNVWSNFRAPARASARIFYPLFF